MSKIILKKLILLRDLLKDFFTEKSDIYAIFCAI